MSLARGQTAIFSVNHGWPLQLLNYRTTVIIIIPNTAVFGPTNFIGTTIASTARMTVYALDESLCTG